MVCRGRGRGGEVKIGGRELKGVYLGVEVVCEEKGMVGGMELCKEEVVKWKGKDVLVMGGGDRGWECMGRGEGEGWKRVSVVGMKRLMICLMKMKMTMKMKTIWTIA